MTTVDTILAAKYPAKAHALRVSESLKAMGLGRVFGSKNGIHGSHIEGIVGKEERKEERGRFMWMCFSV
jgi:hypothetical protein